MRMAMDMMKNMKPDDMQKMMQTVQQNPHLYQQAMNMMQGQGPAMPNMPPTQPAFGGPAPSTSTSQSPEEFPELKLISKLKTEGNDFFNSSKYEEAGSKYLYAIVDIESLRLRLTNSHTSNPKFLKTLNDLEISCRNNYCTAKVKLEEFDLLVKHAERVLELDAANGKAHYNLAQAHVVLRDPKKASKHVDEALKVINNPQILALRDKITEMLNPSISKSENKTQTPSGSKTAEEPKVTPPSDNEFKVIDSEDSAKKRAEQETTEPTIKPNIPVSPPQEQTKEDDFPIQEVGSFEDLEKYFVQENIHTKIEEQPTEPSIPEPIHATKVNSQSTKTETKEVIPPPKATAGSQASFFEKYWQVLLGVLVGLIIAKVLRV